MPGYTGAVSNYRVGSGMKKAYRVYKGLRGIARGGAKLGRFMIKKIKESKRARIKAKASKRVYLRGSIRKSVARLKSFKPRNFDRFKKYNSRFKPYKVLS